MDTIKEKLKLLPKQPGCYLMKNKDNIVKKIAIRNRTQR